MYETKSVPAPPYSSGTHAPMRPSSASFAKSSRGNRCSRSHSAACGSISARAKSRASACTSFCSAEGSKSTGRTILRAGETARTRGSRARSGGGGHGAGGGNARSGRARVEQGAERERQRRRGEALRAQRPRRPAGPRRAPELAGARDCVQRRVAVRRPDRRDAGQGLAATATFVLGRRPKHRCDAPGAKAAAVFTVRNGKIVRWQQVRGAGSTGVTA